MSAAAVNEHERPAPLLRQWWTWVVIIAVVQTGIIFLLGAKQSPAPRSLFPTPPVFLTLQQPVELAELIDPTLFALPNRHGFSGSAWALVPRFGFVSADWTEPLRWLQLPQEKLGEAFAQFIAANPPQLFSVAEKREPQIAAAPAAEFPLPAQSSLRVEGGRELLAPLELTSWPVADVLPATEVQTLVDAGGYVVSVTLLKSCGLSEADQRALELARTARFKPQPGGERERLIHPQAGLGWVKMIFDWHTVAPPAETPTANP